MRIEVTNTVSKVWGEPNELKALHELASFPIEGSQHSQAYKAKMWDGKQALLRRAKGGDHWLLPTGILSQALESLGGFEVEMVDRRVQPGDPREFAWRGKPLRDYQVQAIEAVIQDRGFFTGRGILSLPTRSGKTIVAAGLVQRLGLRTVFVVPSQLLLEQTERSFRACLDPDPVGVVGDGQVRPDWITIATAQSLLRHKALANKLLNEADLVIFDEAHHFTGESWRGLALHADAPYKIGLTATAFISHLKENDKATIWMAAVTGPVLSRVSIHRLVKAGYLMQPRVRFVEFQHEPGTRTWQWQRVARDCLAQCQKRNQLIADIAEREVWNGHLVLIDTGRTDQTKTLAGYMRARDVPTEIMQGSTTSERRQAILAKWRSGEIKCVVGTIIGEGVDIPELSCVINAEGQKSNVASLQRQRQLTLAENKQEPWFWDILDRGQRYLEKHALARLGLYTSLRGFDVETIEMGSPAHPWAKKIRRTS